MASIVIAGWRWIDQTKVVTIIEIAQKTWNGLPF